MGKDRMSPVLRQTSGCAGWSGYVTECWVRQTVRCFGSCFKSRYSFYLVEPIAHTFWGLERTECPSGTSVRSRPQCGIHHAKLSCFWNAELPSHPFLPCVESSRGSSQAAPSLTSCCRGPKFAVPEAGSVFGRWYSALQLLPASYLQYSEPCKI